jgi:hypothetical protein
MSRVRLAPSCHDVPLQHNLDAYAAARRAISPKVPVAQREHNFKEVELGYDERTAQEEAKRCLRCDLEWKQAGKRNGNERVSHTT